MPAFILYKNKIQVSNDPYVNVKKDIFQDYDIVYVVTETASFLREDGWISVFGEPIIFQEPDMLDKIQGRDVNHCISFEQVSDEIIEYFNIQEGDFDSVG